MTQKQRLHVKLGALVLGAALLGCAGLGEPAGGSGEAVAEAPEADPVTCLVDEIYYKASDGSVYGCEGGGNWCTGAPPAPGICAKVGRTSATLPPEMLGAWSPSFGYCRGSDFVIHPDRIEYLAGLEPLGAGRTVWVEPFGRGWTIETILAGEGKFLSLWPSDADNDFAFGIGQTVEKSRVEYCRVQRVVEP